MTKTNFVSDRGVSIDKANETSRNQKFAINFNERTLTEIGSFGGMISAAFPDMREPVLVLQRPASAQSWNRLWYGNYNTIGQGLVNHCVNDILVQGARLCFSRLFRNGKLSPELRLGSRRISVACKRKRLRPLGGETAEMPDLRRRRYDRQVLSRRGW